MIKQSLTKELLYHIINRYVVLFFKYTYVNEIDLRCEYPMESEGTAKPRQTRVESEAPLFSGEEGRQEETHTSLQSHQLTALTNNIFTLKPWCFKRISKFTSP